MRTIPLLTQLLAIPVLSLSVLAGSLTVSAVELEAYDITDADYETRKLAIEHKFNSDKEACNQLKGNKKDLCVEKAEATARTTQLELDAKHKGNVAGHINASESKVDAQYDVDKVRCADQSGDTKDVCLGNAEAKRNKAKADLTLDKKTLEATNDANKKKNDSGYELALKKCAALSSDSKDNCEAMAKRKYHQ